MPFAPCLYSYISAFNSLHQPLQRINPIQPGDRPGDLFPLGHKQVFKPLIIHRNKFFGADNPRIRKIPGTIPEPVYPADLKILFALIFKHVLLITVPSLDSLVRVILLSDIGCPAHRPHKHTVDNLSAFLWHQAPRILSIRNQGIRNHPYCPSGYDTLSEFQRYSSGRSTSPARRGFKSIYAKTVDQGFAFFNDDTLKPVAPKISPPVVPFIVISG